ncbi:MAG TPA: C4-type zinc ribbon domain-containing protein [Acidimicrobiales bacterium]|jgi:hypothetical protein
MSDALARLLIVGDLDTTILQLQHRRMVLAESSGLQAAEATLGAINTAVADASARRAALQSTQKDLEVQIAAVTERRAVVEQRMYAATDSAARDLQAMSDEVTHLKARQGELEEVELVAMVEQEPIDAELAELSARQGPAEAEVARLRAAVAEQFDEIETELAAATAARADEVAHVPASLLERYDRVSRQVKGRGVARLVGHRCDGCRLEMSSVEVERVRHAGPDDVVMCEQCGRILVAS